MSNFIGRKEELAALQELYNKNGFHMAVLFGRRRVGKTTLVNKFIEINKCKSVSFVSTEMAESELMLRMGNDVLETLAPNLNGKLKFDSFDSIFDFMAEEATKEKIGTPNGCPDGLLYVFRNTSTKTAKKLISRQRTHS